MSFPDSPLIEGTPTIVNDASGITFRRTATSLATALQSVARLTWVVVHTEHGTKLGSIDLRTEGFMFRPYRARGFTSAQLFAIAAFTGGRTADYENVVYSTRATKIREQLEQFSPDSTHGMSDREVVERYRQTVATLPTTVADVHTDIGGES